MNLMNAVRRISTHRSDIVMIAVFFAACVALCFVEVGPVTAGNQGPVAMERARVETAADSNIETLGLLETGHQDLTVRILSGQRKGQVLPASNQLRAQMDLDKKFAPGDEALVAISERREGGEPYIDARDHYRTGWTIALFSLFAAFLVCFGGFTGVKALISFVFGCLAVWKIIVPLCLEGHNPMLICLAAVCFLTAVIMFLVAGFNRKGITAFTGAMSGVLASCLLAVIFTPLFHVNGAVMPYSQALHYSGYEFLDLGAIYIGAVFLSSSGAVMDLAMDIAAGMTEVALHHPGVSRIELMRSGLRIGRSVVGTMTTTLLLAYSGGSLTMMMAFAADGVSPSVFVNNPYIASEAVKTLVGSFGLVLVAPCTALLGALIIRRD